MQCNPALPWTPSDGGLITLRDPITRNDLLAGALQITVDGGASGTFIATVVDEAGNNAVQVGGDTLWYISPFTGSVNELELISAETGVVGYDITSIKLNEPLYPTENLKAINIGDDYVVGVEMNDNSYAVVIVNDGAIMTSENGQIDFEPSPYDGSAFAPIDYIQASDIPSTFKQVSAQIVNNRGARLDFGNIQSRVIAVVGDSSPVYIPAS